MSDQVKETLTEIKSQILLLETKHNRPSGSVRLVAISKSQPIEKIKEAIDQGQLDFGENYLQEALEKIEQLNDPNIVWHYTGRIQSKKAKVITQHFNWVHTVSSLKVAELLNKHRPAHLPPLNVCIQVNICDEESKGGVLPQEILSLAKEVVLLPNLKLCGLMTIPIYFKEFDDQYNVFCNLADELKKLQSQDINVDTLSMGMSHDFEAAIAAGATIVRVGSGIFGERKQRTKS